MGTQAENQTVGDSFGRSGATIGGCLDQFAAAICSEFMDEFIKLPDAEECKTMMADFMGLRGIPGIIGAMDGKHWKTCMGGDDEGAFKDFHGNRSLTMLGICDARYRFWWISNFWCGTTHDVRIWRNSSLLKRIVAGTFPPQSVSMRVLTVMLTCCIVVDGAFTGSRVLIKPLTSNQFNRLADNFFSHKYNKLQSSSRQARTLYYTTYCSLLDYFNIVSILI